MAHPHSHAGKLSVVTGASSGIGFELAKCCARDGMDLLIAADRGDIDGRRERHCARGETCDLPEAPQAGRPPDRPAPDGDVARAARSMGRARGRDRRPNERPPRRQTHRPRHASPVLPPPGEIAEFRRVARRA